MLVIDIVTQLLPGGTDGLAIIMDTVPGTGPTAGIGYTNCPTWPPDLFAVVGTIIERSGCYTQASPARSSLATLSAHSAHLDDIVSIATAWNSDPMAPPQEVANLWSALIKVHSNVRFADICADAALVRCLLALFAIADEACVGMGWDVVGAIEADARFFASLVLLHLPQDRLGTAFMPHLPESLCIMVSPDAAVVLPKSITSSVGCTIRSLSHYLALLPSTTVIRSSWTLSSIQRAKDERPDPALPYDIRLLLIPFPFTIHASSFELSTPRTPFGNNNHIPAYFSLIQRWLDTDAGPLTGERMAKELIQPLIAQAKEESGWLPNGIILPECALSSRLAEELVVALADSGTEFLITGLLHVDDKQKTTFNRARTFVIRTGGAASQEQNKHHRWRLDRQQTKRYSLDFDPDLHNDKWWEDIDVGERKLPFFGLRKDMSIATLICEDLARADPAMTAIRAVGPNLVVALLMDGPQLALRWPGRYATVLAEDPGSAVLSLTCAAMVDRSNWLEAKPARSIGLWRDERGTTQEIGLPHGSLAVLLTLQSAPKHQNTLDNRSDNALSRQLTLRTLVPLFLAKSPDWL